MGKKERKWLIPLLIVIAALLVVGLVLVGVYFWIPKPLTLKSGEMIRGKITFDAPGPYYIGDPIPVTMSVESRNGVTYPPFNLTEDNFKPLEIKERSPLTTTKLQGGQVQKISLLMVSWQSGKFTFPAINLPYKDPAGKSGTVKLAARSLKIDTLLPKDKNVTELLKLDVKDLKGPVGMPPRYDILWWSLAGIALVALGWFLYHLLHKRFAKETATINGVIPPEPAHVIALRRLDAIRATDYLANGDFKTFYSELNECAREYLENRFQIRALEMTTEEFLIHVSSSRCLKLEYEQILKEFMKFSDLVKFAKHLPMIEEADHSLEIIRQFIETTKELPVAETASEPVTTGETPAARTTETTE
jgi:phage anti-repressor protein